MFMRTLPGRDPVVLQQVVNLGGVSPATGSGCVEGSESLGISCEFWDPLASCSKSGLGPPLGVACVLAPELGCVSMDLGIFSFQ